MRALLVLLFAAVVIAAPGAGKPRVVHLKDGTKVIGRIVEDECTEDVLVLRLIRGRAKRKIPWSDIKPELAQALKVQLGFAVAAAGEASAIQGHRIVNRAGSAFEGLLLNPKTAERDGYYILKTSDGERRIRLADVQSGPDPVQLDPMDVYTPQEAYEVALKKGGEPKTAEDHFRLAEIARMYGALEPAKHHLEQVLAVDDPAAPKYQKDKIERLLEVVNKLLGSRQALDELTKIRRSIVYRKYKQAAEEIQAFREKYAEKAHLTERADQLEKELQAKRASHYIGEVPRLLRNTVRDLLLQKVKQRDVTLRHAQQYAIPQGRRREFLQGVRGGMNDPTIETSVTADALRIVGEKLGITPDEVESFWTQRPKRSWNSAFYRDGTFIVIDDLEDALQSAPKVKLKKGSKRPKLPKPKKQKTPDGWWEGKVKQRKFSDLRDWLYAWWAEKSGMCEVLNPKEEICPTCHGKGYVPKILTTAEGSIPWFDRCPTCHMAKHLRVVRFK